MTFEQWKEFEASHRREISGDVAHPDNCPKLTIFGVEFAIPSRKVQPTASLIPKFTGGKVVLTALEAPEVPEWPEIKEVSLGAPVVPVNECPTCGHIQELQLEDMADHVEYFGKCMELAARALRCQYELSDDELSMMFEPLENNDTWLVGLLEWCA